MPMNEMQKQTNANIQAKANLIWEIATHLVGLFKPHEYGKVILPMTVLKRFDDALKPTKAAVVEMAKKLDAQHVEGTARDGILCRVAQYDFYNTSNYDFAKLIADPDNVESNFDAYLQGFSSNIKDIIENFDFANTVKLMVKGGALFVTLQEFNSAKADMSPEKITSADMGYIFEELIRKFSESYDDQAGAHLVERGADGVVEAADRAGADDGVQLLGRVQVVDEHLGLIIAHEAVEVIGDVVHGVGGEGGLAPDVVAGGGEVVADVLAVVAAEVQRAALLVRGDQLVDGQLEFEIVLHRDGALRLLGRGGGLGVVLYGEVLLVEDGGAAAQRRRKRREDQYCCKRPFHGRASPQEISSRAPR